MIVDQLSKRQDVPSISGELSCKLLTDNEALNVYNDLRRLIRPGYQHTRQDKAILRIAKYKFSWSGEMIFHYILQTCPELRSRLTNYELKHPKLNTLLRIATFENKDKVIKRLIAIEKKNEAKKLQT